MNFFEKQTLDSIDPRFKSWYGKKVQFLDEKGKRHVGWLDFSGVNDLHGQFQVTISRTPIWPVDPNTIKLVK